MKKRNIKHIGQVDFVDKRAITNWHYPSQTLFFQMKTIKLIPGLFGLTLKLVGSKSYSRYYLIDWKSDCTD